MCPKSVFFHYPPVTRAGVEWGAYLAGGGRSVVRPGATYPPDEGPNLYAFSWRHGRTLPEYQIRLIQDGKGEFQAEEVDEQAFGANALLLLFPNVWHRYRPDPQTGWTERWISFNGELVHRLYDALRIGPDQALAPISATSADLIARRFDDFLERMHADPTQNAYLLSTHMMSLVADVLECVAIASEPERDLVQQSICRHDADPVVVQALELIWTHSNRPISVAELARRMSVKRRTLDRHFSRMMGHSILAEIKRCRLARAKRLLRETSIPIKAVAHLAGFTDQERLRVSFADSEGISPSEFRARHGRVVKRQAASRRPRQRQNGSKQGH